MNRHRTRIARFLFTLIACSATIAFFTIPTLAETDCAMRTDGWIGCDPIRSPSTVNGPAVTPVGAMSKPVSNLLKAALDAGAKKDWETAKARLADARAVASPSEMDVFEIDVAASYIAINTGDHPQALAAYRRSSASPLFSTALTPPERSATLKNAMVLCNEIGDYRGAIAFGERMIDNGAIDNVSAVSLATAYFGNGEWAKAQRLAQKAIDASIAAGIKPSDVALQIVLKSQAAQRQ